MSPSSKRVNRRPTQTAFAQARLPPHPSGASSRGPALSVLRPARAEGRTSRDMPRQSSVRRRRTRNLELEAVRLERTGPDALEDEAFRLVCVLPGDDARLAIGERADGDRTDGIIRRLGSGREIDADVLDIPCIRDSLGLGTGEREAASLYLAILNRTRTIISDKRL